MHIQEEKRTKLIFNIGLLLLIVSTFLLILILSPILQEEVTYYTDKPYSQVDKEIIPVDLGFGIVIPKINANSRVVQDVNPYDAAEYQQKLTKGVAHAKGTSLPGEGGNVFLFAHSSDNFYNANRYNSVFYLLNKLEIGDELYVYKDGLKFVYAVSSKEIAQPEEINYLTDQADSEQLTLMTCWPPGTTLKRLIIQANLQ